MLEGMKEAGVDSERLLQLYINSYNDCLKDRPADMVVGVHLCRGNFKVSLLWHYWISRHHRGADPSSFREAGTSAKAATIASL
jgi:methionine synthase II (cobalamin-independent)